jgi:dipeptidyl aminopeptidase/acylaminoacyl peptidase/ssDNA-binding Zn-finger/Zn-ribbon topoisomerase 1
MFPPLTEKRKRFSYLFCLAAFFACAALAAAAAKKPISYDAYDGWRSINGSQLSRDGGCLVYALVPQEGDGELVALNLKTRREIRTPRGEGQVITPDSHFIVFTVAPQKAEVDKAKKEKKKPDEMPKNGLGIIDLSTGKFTTVERVKSFKIPKESGAFIAYLLEPPLKKQEAKKEEPMKEETGPGEAKAEKKEKEKKKEFGTELVVVELASGKETKIPEVVEYIWAKDGSRLAYAVSSKKPENDGAFIIGPAAGKSTELMKGLGHYKGLAFDEKGIQLAFISDRDNYKDEAPAFKLYHWAAPAASASELAPAQAKNFPAGMAVSENRVPFFSEDGRRLFFGIAAAPIAPLEDAQEPIKVDIWNWKDPYLQPMQKARAEQDKKFSYLSVFHLGPKEKKFVRLANNEVPEITLSDDAVRAVANSNVSYRQLISWDRDYSDVYLVDINTGTKKKIVDKSSYDASFSPGGNYLYYFSDASKAWYTYRIADGKTFNLTGKIGVRFDSEVWDTPQEPAPYGVAGWTEGDGTILIYDRYDIWEISQDGAKARMVTSGFGRENNIVFRRLKFDPEEKSIKAKEPMILSATEENTMASGAFRADLTESRDPVKIVMQDKLFRGLQKAKNADVYVFTWQRFEEFPDLWVSGLDFASARKVSNANPQQAEYIWGKAELIKYTNTDGMKLNALLYRPDDFDPAKKYPLMVYIYERLSQGLHRYYPPSPGTSINFTRYISNGYIILMPDIVYEVGYPGQSTLKCVIPAVNEVLDMGFVDPKRIGIQGHSWGGYQITYLITHTSMFAAAQAGASVANMTSAYGGIRWGTGKSRAYQYEKTQSRIGAPLWERTLQFIENSPIFWVEKVKTPYLSIHNDDDDAVPWYQGIEFFSAMRRLGKEAYMFNYNGEKHSLREWENQKHWTVHQDEFFDHYLKGAPRPEWMEKGVPYLERGKRDVTPFYKGTTIKEEKKR